jgi:hypothetical protein
MMYYRKYLQILALFCLFSGSLSAQAVDFRILYQWFPGPNNTDTVRLYVESANTTPVTITAVNFSIAFRSTCDSLISFNQIFSGLWGTLIEQDTIIPLPIPRNYGGINYDRRIQYGNAVFFAIPGIIAPPIQDSALCFAEAIFKRNCSDFPYVEDESENPLNQWQGPLGSLSYEVIPIVVLPELHIAINGRMTNEGRASVYWEISDPGLIRKMALFRAGKEEPVWEGKPNENKRYTFSEQLVEYSATYQLWLETLEGDRVVSRKVVLNWGSASVDADIFPIPANEALQVRWREGAPSAGMLYIFDAQGRRIASHKVEEGEHRAVLPVEGMPSGTYFLRWAGQNSFSKSITIIH